MPLSFVAEYDKELILKSICALLNGEGEWIVVGMSSDGKSIGISEDSLGSYTFNGKFYMKEGHEIVVPNMQQLASLLTNGSTGQDIWELRTCMQADESDVDTELMRHVYQEGKKG